MTFNVEAAKKAGYSDQEIQSFLGKSQDAAPKQFNVESAKKAGYSDDEIQKFLGNSVQDTKKRFQTPLKHGVASLIAEHPVESATGAALTFGEPLEQIAGLAEPGGLISSIIRGRVPTPLTDAAKQASGINDLSEDAKKEAEVLNFVAALAPVERALSLGGKGAKAVSELGRSATEAKVPSKVAQDFAERAAIMEGKIKPKEVNLVSEKFESGLTKPRSVESKNHHLATIDKNRQQKVIYNLEKEAQSLIKGRIEERVPLSKKISEGFDFGKYHEEEFGKLKNSAEKFNPHISTSPLRKFFSETREKYKGIPDPHADAKSILREISSYIRTSPSDLKTLLKIRKSNTQKLSQIYDRRLAEGKRHEYVDFLNAMNRNIDESIGKTLPEDSKWFKRFKEINREYADFKNAEKTLKILEPILREKISNRSLGKIAQDPKVQKELRFKMGEKGANEVIQISKDLIKATDSIKKMTVKEKSLFDSVWPLSFFSSPSSLAAVSKKGYDWARKGYGYYLSHPEKREVFEKAIKAISNHDVSSYKAATEKL